VPDLGKCSPASPAFSFLLGMKRARVRVPTMLRRALRALAHEAVVTEDRSNPSGSVWEPAVRGSIVVLPARATRVP
jgi:hypothetical protein